MSSGWVQCAHLAHSLWYVLDLPEEEPLSEFRNTQLCCPLVDSHWMFLERGKYDDEDSAFLVEDQDQVLNQVNLRQFCWELLASGEAVALVALVGSNSFAPCFLLVNFVLLRSHHPIQIPVTLFNSSMCLGNPVDFVCLMMITL